MKTLDLYACESYKHVSYEGLSAANAQACMHFRGRLVEKVFTPCLRPAIETMTAMMVNNASFAKAEHYSGIEGLGHESVVPLLYNDEFCDLIDGGVAVMDALKMSHDPDVQHVFREEAMLAVEHMFARLQEGERGAGVFLGHFIIMAAYASGLRDIHSLEPLEAISFEFHDDDNIVAKRKLIC